MHVHAAVHVGDRVPRPLDQRLPAPLALEQLALHVGDVAALAQRFQLAGDDQPQVLRIGTRQPAEVNS